VKRPGDSTERENHLTLPLASALVKLVDLIEYGEYINNSITVSLHRMDPLCDRTYGGKLTDPLRKEVTGVPSSSSHPLEWSVTFSNWRLNLGFVIDHNLVSNTTHFLVITRCITPDMLLTWWFFPIGSIFRRLLRICNMWLVCHNWHCYSEHICV
jgi:hypothetical protein